MADQPPSSDLTPDDFFEFLEDIYDQEIRDLRERVTGLEGMEATVRRILGMLQGASLLITILLRAPDQPPEAHRAGLDQVIGRLKNAAESAGQDDPYLQGWIGFLEKVSRLLSK